MITMQEIIKVDDPSQYKLHLASHNDDGEHPLDVYIADHNEWLGWNKWKGLRNDWNRNYIFSLIKFYPEEASWLFGGIFKVVSRHETYYELDEVEDYKKYVGRVLLSFDRPQGMMGRALNRPGFAGDSIS